MNDLLADPTVGQLVGVIDLSRGRAVHAIAGERSQYEPVAFCDGDAVVLAQHYLRLGVHSLYVADLDALSGGQVQCDAIEKICRASRTTETLVDVGLTGNLSQDLRTAIRHTLHSHPSVRWIAASESCRFLDAVNELATIVPSTRLLIGLDFRNGVFLAEDQDPNNWIAVAKSIGCHGVVVLDLASVGKSSGVSTIATCQSVKERAPELTLYSGGGIRDSSDLVRLSQAGCDRFLVATALHPKQ